ncbi:MAG: hypothetical protein JNM93_12920 [Bacteriovoracaceae bacterium]|nr:hypothetical protein [Bacteriovoracaceae bacterium]
MKKYGLKLFSVVFAFFLWLYVIGTADMQVEKEVNIRYILPQNKIITDTDVKSTIYHLSGPRAFMRNIEKREEIITIDLNKYMTKNPNEIEVQFNPQDLSLPFGIKVGRIEPKKLTIHLEKAVTKELYVRPILTGVAADNQKIAHEQVLPPKVRVQGPESMMNKLHSLETKPISLSTLTGEGKLKVGLHLPFEQLHLLDDEFVNYQYSVKPTKANKVIENIKIKFLSSRLIKSVSKRTVSLLVYAEDLDKIESLTDEIEVIAEISEKHTGKVEIELKAIMPQGLLLLEIRPNRIFVTIN